MVERWQSGVYFDAGMYDGQISQYMGLVPNPYTAETEAEQLDGQAPAQYIAGWLYGISWQQEDLRDKIIACYTENDIITQDYFDGMAAYSKGDTETATAKFNDAGEHYDEAFANCDSSITDVLTQWKTKLTDLEKIDNWDTISQ